MTLFSQNPVRRTLALLGTVALLTVAAATARAFDAPTYTAKLDATIAELKTKALPDSAATLARLDDLSAQGGNAAKDYGAKQAKYAPLMNLLVTQLPAIKAMSANEIEEKWGENGSAGDAVGIPLKSLGQYDEQRNYIELALAPASAYVQVKKWTTAQKAHYLDDAKDELIELGNHVAKLH